MCNLCFLSVLGGCFPLQLSPSVLWYCWLGLLTCKNRLPYNLYCIDGDVKHCTIQSNPIHIARHLWFCGNDTVFKIGCECWYYLFPSLEVTANILFTILLLTGCSRHSAVYAVAPYLSVPPSQTNIVFKTAEPRMIWFSRQGSPENLVFSDAKTLQKFEGYHLQRNTYLQVILFYHSKIIACCCCRSFY